MRELGRLAGPSLIIDERLEPWDTAADDAEMDLDGGPDPEVEALPCRVEGPLNDVVDPVGAHTAGDADEETEAEEDDEGDALGERELGVVECP